MFADVHLVPEAGRAVAVFGAGAEVRGALADSVSFLVSRRFQVESLDTDAVIELRAAGALADRLDEHRGVEGLAPVRVDASQVRLLIEAVWSYIAERDVDTYQPPEERARIEQLQQLSDPLFDLLGDLDRADKVLGASSI